MIQRCELTDTFVYQEDAFVTKTGYVSILGKYLFYDAKNKQYKACKIRNFFLYLFPYILAALFVIVSIIVEAAKIKAGVYDYIMLGFFLGMIVIFSFSTVSILKNHGISDEVGNPERTIYEASGTINLDTGSVYARGRAYDTYSGEQWITILLNIIKFIVAFVLVACLSWLYWIIYTIRAHKNKKVYNQLANFINDDKYYTGIASCLGDSEVFDNDSICVYDLNKNKVDSQFEYFATFTKGGETIYAISKNFTEEKY